MGHLSFTEILDTSLKVSWKEPHEKNGVLTGDFTPHTHTSDHNLLFAVPLGKVSCILCYCFCHDVVVCVTPLPLFLCTGYRISWEEFNRTNTRVTHYLPNLTQEYRVTGLTALTTYTIQVAGMTTKGQGQLSSSTISSGVPPGQPQITMNKSRCAQRGKNLTSWEISIMHNIYKFAKYSPQGKTLGSYTVLQNWL